MDNTLHGLLQQAQRLNEVLLALSAEGEWPRCIALFSDYSHALSGVLNRAAEPLSAAERQNLRQVVTSMLQNDAIVQQRMRQQKETLRQQLVSLQKSSAVSQAYRASSGVTR